MSSQRRVTDAELHEWMACPSAFDSLIGENWLADRAAVRALEHAIRDADTHGWDGGSILRVVGEWKALRQRMKGWDG